MSLKKLLSKVLDDFENLPIEDESSVLEDIPIETLYLAIKEADALSVAWFFEKASSRQVQALVDLDCWSGSEFRADRYLGIFRCISHATSKKVLQYSKELDPEILVRGLIEYCEVFDYDPDEVPNVPEKNLLLTLDHKYAIVISHPDKNFKEDLFQWINKLSAENIDLLRRHLESCKWEQKTEIEEFAYQIKKGRLEELGFVDRHESLSLYSLEEINTLKEKILNNRFDKGFERYDEVDSVDARLLPVALSTKDGTHKLLQAAFEKLDNLKEKEIISREMFRVINAAIVADDHLHDSIEEINRSSQRSKDYLELGLNFLAQNDAQKAADFLRGTKLWDIHRLGWLSWNEINSAAKKLAQLEENIHFLKGEDREFLCSFGGRHLQINADQWKLIGGETGSPQLDIQSLHLLASYIKTLEEYFQYGQSHFNVSLKLNEDPLKEEESLSSRLMTGLFRQSQNSEFRCDFLSEEEWDSLCQSPDWKQLGRLIELSSKRCPENLVPYWLKSLNDNAEELQTYLKINRSYPDSRHFKALRLAPKEAIRSHDQ